MRKTAIAEKPNAKTRAERKVRSSKIEITPALLRMNVSRKEPNTKACAGVMNTRGIFMTFMAFLLITAIVSVYSASRQIGASEEQRLINSAVFNTVNDRFNNVFEEVVGLNKEGYARIVQQRAMPFEYDMNTYTIKIRQLVPQRTSTLSSYIDALNIYSIFTKDQQQEGNMDVSTAPTKDTRWGGAEQYPLLTYAVLPQCLLYDVNNGNTMRLRAGVAGQNKCAQDFAYAGVAIIDINIGVDTQRYSQAEAGVTCNGAFAAAGCIQSPRNPGDPNPYGVVRIEERNNACPGVGCLLTDPTGHRAIAAHFNPDETVPDSVVIRANATSEVKVKFGREGADDTLPLSLRNGYPSTPLQVDANITFNSRPALFYFTGFGIEVSKENFSTVRRT